MREQLTTYIRAGYPGLFIVSTEEARVEAELKAVAAGLGYGLWAWSVTTGLVNTNDGSSSAGQAQEALEAVAALRQLPESTILLLRDLHLFLDDPNPILVRAIRDELAVAKTRGTVMVILGCRRVLPPELEHEFVVQEFALPDKAGLGAVLDGICDSAQLKVPEGDCREQILDAAAGLTTSEAENALALSIVECKCIDAGVVMREKVLGVGRSGIVEVVQVREQMADIGGLDQLKAWLTRRKDAFGLKAQEYGLPSPRGLLIFGIPGCGKSLTAKAAANALGRPLLKLDAGRLFGGLVGQSESNMRAVIQTAEAVAPCVLWLDEIEKGFAGSQGSASDGGTASRVFGTFATWMSERRAPVFVVATANDVTRLPPEFLRRGRWDELFFVDLPNAEERLQIWQIQILKHGRKPEDFDLPALAEMSQGYTGAEIEAAFIDGLHSGFAADQEPTTAMICRATADCVPLSKLTAESIEALRKWSVGRARPATSPEAKPRAQGRRLAAA